VEEEEESLASQRKERDPQVPLTLVNPTKGREVAARPKAARRKTGGRPVNLLPCPLRPYQHALPTPLAWPSGRQLGQQSRERGKLSRTP
jgi:hypothetical protein